MITALGKERYPPFKKKSLKCISFLLITIRMNKMSI